MTQEGPNVGDEHAMSEIGVIDSEVPQPQMGVQQRPKHCPAWVISGLEFITKPRSELPQHDSK